MEKCSNCPMLNMPEDCPAITKNVKRYCKLVDPQDPSYNPAYRAIIVSEATGQQAVKEEMGPAIVTVKEKPSLLKRAVNLAGATYEHLRSGMAVVSDDEKERRLSICKSCEWYDAENKICNKCGCYCELKASWSTSHCPIFKWGAIPEPERLIDDSLNFVVQTVGDPSVSVTHIGGDCNCGSPKNSV